jgi:hypothetical protein
MTFLKITKIVGTVPIIQTPPPMPQGGTLFPMNALSLTVGLQWLHQEVGSEIPLSTNKEKRLCGSLRVALRFGAAQHLDLS